MSKLEWKQMRSVADDIEIWVATAGKAQLTVSKSFDSGYVVDPMHAFPTLDEATLYAEESCRNHLQVMIANLKENLRALGVADSSEVRYECSGRDVNGCHDLAGCRLPAIGGFIAAGGTQARKLWLFCGVKHKHPCAKPMSQLIHELLEFHPICGEISK